MAKSKIYSKGGYDVAKDMTTGNISKHLISFAIPMVLGNLFQLTYNAVDSIIVGRYVGTEALAAVGAANPIMNIIIFFIVGICMGASILMSEFYGAGDLERLKKEISTSLIMGLIFTITISFLCFFLVKPILILTKTPQEIIPVANNYLRIICSGLMFTFLYNIYAATLRSVGDSKTPIYFLVISSILNVVLDLLFVVKLGLGVKGAAIATVIAQGVCCVLCIGYVYKYVPILRIKRSELEVDKKLLKKTINYGWVTAMQQTCLYVGKLLVQGAVNPLGIESIATFNAVTRVDDFVFTPQQSIASAMTTYIAQNRGANKADRIKKGFRCGMYIETIYWGIIAVIVYMGAKGIVGLFVTETNGEIISLGGAYLRSMAFFYIMPAITNGIQGYFRGMGELKVTLRSTFIQMTFRVMFSYLLASRWGIPGIAMSCFGGWVAMLAYEVPIYLKYRRKVEREGIQSLAA